MKKIRRFKIGFSTTLLLLLFFMAQATMLVVPEKASALSPDVVAEMVTENIAKTFWQKTREAVELSVGTMLVNLMTYTANELAYSAAMYVATGGPGETSLFVSSKASDYFGYVGTSVVMATIEGLEEQWGGINFLPTDPYYLENLRTGIVRGYMAVPSSGFDFEEISGNWDGFKASINASQDDSKTKTQAILKAISSSFDDNEIIQGTQATLDTYGKSIATANLETMEVVYNSHYAHGTDGTGNITTPANFINSQVNSAYARVADLPTQISIGAMAGSDNLLSQLGVSMVSVFTNTLTSELMKKAYSGMFDDIAPYVSPYDLDGLASMNRERAEDVFRSLKAYKPIQVTDYSLIIELSSCSINSFDSVRQLYSCAMDTSFAAAVSRSSAGSSMTLSDAIDEGYINENWALISSSDTARNQDVRCYTYGFCHSNLIKLRKARIIPIGWELAAESPYNSTSDPVTLGEVMDGFYDCNSAGEADDNFPWCHLIDPNWILKAPQTQCRTYAYGQLLEMEGAQNRAQECVDVQSCVSEGDNGTCEGGYGYCVREKNIWRFHGDECPEQYASCLTFEDADGIEVNYLTSTIDRSNCSESTAGCLWYSTIQRLTDDDNYDWPVIGDLAMAESQDDIYKERIYLNDKIEDCSESNAGCSEIFVRESGVSLNSINNSSFEIDDDENNRPDGWFTASWADIDYDNENGLGRSGYSAISPTAESLYQYGPALNQARFYAFSFYTAQASDTATDTIVVTLSLEDEFEDELVDLTGTGYTGDCSLSDLDGDGNYESVTITAIPESTSYERFECIFTAPTLDNESSKLNTYIEINSSSVWIDDLQIEQNEIASSYHLAYSRDLTADYVKLPPAYLGCTGSVDDAVECDSYATMCSSNDAGCLLYTPLNGDPAISAIVSEIDECPSECDGYDTYKQEGTRYEPNGEFPLYLIPSTADECNESSVGCDEFTNLSTENKEYYTYLRACVDYEQAGANTNGDQDEVFYTWEGSDEAGYQLKTWYLLESDLDATAYSSYSYGSFVETDPGAAPCTNWSTDEDGITCNDDSDGDLAIDNYSALCNEHDDIFENPTCREFYDAVGGIHYRDWRDTVTVNDDCVTYRKTDIAGLGEDNDSDGTDDGYENCVGGGGYFDLSINACKFFGLGSESVECSASANGCRQYTGGRSSNSRLAFSEYFEDGSLSNWDASSGSGVTLSNESIATGGHSLESSGLTIWTHFYDNGSECTTEYGCLSSTAKLGGECTVLEGDTYCGTLNNELFTGKTYTLSFWAKGSGTIDVGFDIEASGSASLDVAFEEDIELSSEWERFSIGPLNMSKADYEDFGEGTVLVFKPDTGGVFYIDNVSLREGEDNLTLIKDSWQTPSTCDLNLSNQASPQYHLGCSAYSSSKGDTVYLKSFSSLCDEDKVGCSAYYQTHESESTKAEILNATCYNVVQDISGNPQKVAGSTICYLEGESGTSGTFDTDSEALCTIPSGSNSCLFDLNFYIPETALVSDPLFEHLAYQTETVYIPADSDFYAIVDSEDTCSSRSAGCQELGLPILSADKTVVDSWETVYLINDPDNYSDTLCSSGSAFCAKYDAGSEGVYYFKDPGKGICEYKTDISIDGTKYNGWFQSETNEFCYGNGTCVDSGATCSNDSDCRIDTGSCSTSGAICSNDSDCPADEFCSDASDDTCKIDTATYLVGGKYSDIWLTGDEDYEGWVGVCDSDNNGCSELRDPLDIDDDEFYASAPGESYFFINNDSLSGGNLLSSNKCDGKVSQEYGCSLFDDTGDINKKYNASATYISSRHSDELFGETPFSLVNPIDCDRGDSTITTMNGEEIDLCAQRCIYKSKKLNTTDRTLGPFDYTFGGSCYSSDDCVDYENNVGDLVSGTCRSQVRTGFLGGEIESVPILENDTNKILRVDRDRVCSEWLTCSSARTVWDSDTASYRTVCDAVDLCTEYSDSGDASFCSAWDPDDPAVILDDDKYISRDISWYGEEYSGYAIPDIYPIQHLDQINISSANYCGNDKNDLDYNQPCDSDSDCIGPLYATCFSSNPNYRLGFIASSNADSCDDDDFETECIVGYCEDTGAVCGANVDCPTGECITGICYEVTATSCSSDDNCDVGTGEECLDGVCVVEGDGCDMAYGCGTGETCYVSESAKTGTCFYGNCALTIEGNTFDEELAEEMICRAYPEQNSPFSNRVVEDWKYQSGPGADFSTTSDPSSLDLDEAVPYSTVSGYENVSLCGPNEECECSYTSVSTAGGKTVYTELDTKIKDYGGICNGGFFDGSLCVYDPSTSTTVCGGEGTCDRIQQKDQLIGLEGYCLEHDTGINLYGDPQTGACLNWLPVDQLRGSTDLFAKFINAGYNGGETEYCSYVTPYVNVYASEAVPNEVKWEDSDIACLEREKGSTSTSDEAYDKCVTDNGMFMGCPPGFFLLVGNYYQSSDDDDTFAEACKGGSTKDNDCPFMCVPENSVTTLDDGGKKSKVLCSSNDILEYNGASVQEKSSAFSLTNLTTATGEVFDYEGRAFWYDDPSDFSEIAPLLTDCTSVGQDSYLNWSKLTTSYFSGANIGLYGMAMEDEYTRITHVGSADKQGWYNYKQDFDIYPGCVVSTVVDDGEYIEVAPYTDRLLGSGYTLNTNDSSYAYDETTGRFPFGKALTKGIIESLSDPSPSVVAYCYDSSGTNPVFTSANVSGCDSGELMIDDLEDADARSYVNIDFEFDLTYPYKSTFDVYSLHPDDVTTDPASIYQVHDMISNLFAKSIDMFRFDDGLSDEDHESNGSIEEYDEYSIYKWDDRAEGSPPKIWSVDTSNCYGSYCREGSLGQITLNDKDEGEQISDGGFFRANVKFFTGADKNQLPIRRIIVDWGDGEQSGSDDDDNFYKNHRGLLVDSQTQTYCDTDAEWGMTADSCDPNYLNYTHNYRCSTKIMNTLPNCSTVTVNGDIIEACQQDDKCVYQPRVHVRDNWGWCTGVCDSADPSLNKEGTEYCFDSYGDLTKQDSYSECNYNKYPKYENNTNPWVYYDGLIIVSP